MSKQSFSHLNTDNKPAMVDVGEKTATKRLAQARSIVVLDDAIWAKLNQKEIESPKGPVFQTAIIAGVMAAKKTGELIPLCHPIGLENCQIEISINQNHEVEILCTASLTGKTGVEMEALTGATVAALTIYDMCKGLSHNIVIKETRLIAKSGGKRDFKLSEL